MIRSGEYIINKIKNIIPDSLQYKVNQFILNNTIDYNNTYVIHKETNNLSIYNTPNSENNAYIRNNPDKELSPFAIDYMNFNGLEKVFKTGHIKKLNTESTSLLLQLKH